MLRAESEPGHILSAHIAHLDEAGLEAVEEGFEVDHARGEDAETLDDLGANGCGPDVKDHVA